MRYRHIVALALPIIVQRLVFQMQSLTDKLFLGALDTRYLAALGTSQFPLSTTFDTLTALCAGIAIVVSRHFGARNLRPARAVIRAGILCNSLVSMLFLALWLMLGRALFRAMRVRAELLPHCLSYVRICALYFVVAGLDASVQAFWQGIGRTGIIMLAGIIKVSLNVFLTWILVSGRFGIPSLGMSGAALGTLAANVVSCAFNVLCFLRARRAFFPKMAGNQGHAPFFAPYREAALLGVPVALEWLVWNCSNLVLIALLNSFSYAATATFTLTAGIEVVAYAFYCGNAAAAMTLIGHRLGAGDRRGARELFYSCLVLNCAVVAAFIALFRLRAQQIIGIFTSDTELVHGAAPFLFATALIMVPKSINVICGNTLKAYKDTLWLLKMQLLGSTIVILLSLCLVRGAGMTAAAIYLTLLVDESVRAVINFARYRRVSVC